MTFTVLLGGFLGGGVLRFDNRAETRTTRSSNHSSERAGSIEVRNSQGAPAALRRRIKLGDSVGAHKRDIAA